MSAALDAFDRLSPELVLAVCLAALVAVVIADRLVGRERE
jgi:preprotein translocase subunit Sec61beta